MKDRKNTNKKKGKNKSKNNAGSSNKQQQQQQQQAATSSTPPTGTGNNNNNNNNRNLLLQAAHEYKTEGNACFKVHRLQDAIDSYSKGLDIIDKLQETYNINNNPTVIELLVQLYMNRAQVYLKNMDFDKAEIDCNFVLDDLQQETSFKAWYRRALAREGMASNAVNTNTIEKIELLLQAKHDLQQCLKECKQDAEKRTVMQAAQRLQKTILMLEDKKNKKTIKKTTSTRNNDNNNNNINPNNNNNNNSNIPPPFEQKQDILRLLQFRHEFDNTSKSATNNGSSNNSNKKSSSIGSNIILGEALFLIDWHWWNHWCRYVQLFQNNNNDNNINNRILSWLPPGAVLPDEKHDDDDEEEENKYEFPPGPIDNTDLLLPTEELYVTDDTNKIIYYQHWYRSYIYNDNLNEGDENNNNYYYGTDQMIPIRPGLVRGHHYELLPREVYNALKLLYDEVTPSICRRAQIRNNNNNGKQQTMMYIQLYPLFDVNHNNNNMKSDLNDDSINSCRSNTGGSCGACGTPNVYMRCRNCMAVYYCDRECQEQHWKYAHKSECKALKVAVATANNNNGTVPIYENPILYKKTGLNNLGNTCFMNSALQSLSHATPLTRHFLSGKFRKDLNTDNPLGTGGKLALAYEDVMKSLHCSNKASCSPTALKRAIAMFAPRFAGYLQHDAQEFLAYLLDGLHEDLNRIRKAPYVELPDFTDGVCMAIAGAKAWDAHLRRNDSLVLDTFYGQFKSTCVCPTCNRVSVSFDAFNHISLEIPQERNAIVPISFLVFPASGNPPIRYGVQTRRTNCVRDLKESLSQLCDIQSTQLLMCEVYDNAIFDIYKDERRVSELPNGELIVVYEADPISGPGSEAFCHVIASHRLVESNQGSTVSIGYPFLTSFSRNMTCREIWEHIWNMVSRMVVRDNFDAKTMLRIRIVDSAQKDLLIFPVAQQDEEKLDDNDSEIVVASTSVIPMDCDETLISFLGEDAMNAFVFFNLDWTDPNEAEEIDNNAESKNELLIEEERFLEYKTDQTWVEIEKTLREKSAKKGVTLDQCFETFIKPERLDEHNKWYCSKCKEHVCAMKTMELWKLPNILIIHLKRFEFRHALRRDKLDTLVDFPLDGLDVNVHRASLGTSSFVDDGVPAIYDCFAVVNHFGRMGFGHYTAFARRFDETGISDDWALFDDSRVHDVGDDPKTAVISPAAYVLFYRRRIFH